MDTDLPISDPNYLDRLLAGGEPSTHNNETEVLSGTRFFDRNGLLHARLRHAVIDLGPIAVGPGSTLWYYDHGVWLAGGENEVRRRCRTLLGDRWRKSHVEGLISDLSADREFITDAQPTEYINCKNGLLNWRTGELLPHRADVASTYQLRVNWNPAATCPTVDDWLHQVAPDDAIGLCWEVIGTAIYPDQPFHRAVLLLGPGRNGKGTFLRLVTAMIGQRHISAVTLQQLGENRFVAAELFGKVANIAGDLDARAITRTDVFKMATGGDLVPAERKYGQPFSFTNRATMLFSANEPPGSSDQTTGFFSRWVVLPFDRIRLTEGQEDHSIEQRMHLELEGVLVAAVEGLRRAIDRRGYDTPVSVRSAMASYQDNIDPVRRFFAESLHVTGSHDDRERRSTVYDRYREWCDENGHRPKASSRFWPHVETLDLGITSVTIRGITMATGVRTSPPPVLSTSTTSDATTSATTSGGMM